MTRAATLVALVFSLAGAGTADAAKFVVHDGESIQAKIDAAPAGSTIIVKPGVYREPGATRAITISKNGIHLVAAPRHNQPVVLEQSGTQTQGIWVSPDDSLDPADVELPPCGVSGQRLRNFSVNGFTVEGFAGFGIYLACVDGFASKEVQNADHPHCRHPITLVDFGDEPSYCFKYSVPLAW